MFDDSFLSYLFSDFGYLNCIINQKCSSLRFITGKNVNYEDLFLF
jgi:hypothetical protein